MVKSTALLGLSAALLLGAPAGARPDHPHPVAGSGSTRAGVFEAGNEGSTWALPGDVEVRLAAHSSMRMFQQPQLLQLGPGKRTRTYTLLLVRGTAYLNTSASETAVLVTTRDKVNAIVRHGQAAFAASATERAVLNVDAQVLLSVGGGAYSELAPGKTLAVDASGSLEERKPPPMPTFEPGQRVWVTTSGFATVSGVTWSKGAARYRTELRDLAGASAPISRTTQEPSLPPARLAAGSYAVSVTPLDAMGLPGPRSASLRLHVVQPVVPEGSFVDARGVVRLGRGQGLTFAGADGLSVTYGSDGHFFAAQGPVRLRDNRPATVYFHAAGGADITSTRVEPRGIVARIAFSPKNAVWPDQPLHIRVRLASRRGEALPDWLKPRVRVLLGVEPVAVDFARNGDQLVGTLPAADTPGPWVVRVEVEDQYGIALGRNFTEVARSRRRFEQRVAVSRR